MHLHAGFVLLSLFLSNIILYLLKKKRERKKKEKHFIVRPKSLAIYETRFKLKQNLKNNETAMLIKYMKQWKIKIDQIQQII